MKQSPGSNRSLSLRAAAILAIVAGSLSLPALAFGRAVVLPATSISGGREAYNVRVPNEREIPTTRIEIRFPAGLRVSSFAEVAGWQIEVVLDSAKKIVGANYTGNLPPHRYVILPFLATNPKDVASMSWPVIQVYGNGERVEWTGGAGSTSPASVTTLTNGPAEVAGRRLVSWMAGLAFVLSLFSLVLAMRRRPTANLA